MTTLGLNTLVDSGACLQTATLPMRRLQNAQSFGRSIRTASNSVDFQTHLNSAAKTADDTELHESAVKLVSSAFLLPMLQEFRDTSMAVGPFAAGTAEKRFGPMLDQRLADAITSSPNFPLVNAIIDRYKNQAVAGQAALQTLGGLNDVTVR